MARRRKVSPPPRSLSLSKRRPRRSLSLSKRHLRTNSTNLDPMDPAANYLRAELLPSRTRGWRKLGRYGAMAVQVLSGEIPTNVDLVVYRRDTGSEVMRTPADVGSPDILLDQVNADLKSKTVTEFLAEWRLDE